MQPCLGLGLSHRLLCSGPGWTDKAESEAIGGRSVTMHVSPTGADNPVHWQWTKPQPFLTPPPFYCSADFLRQGCKINTGGTIERPVYLLSEQIAELNVRITQERQRPREIRTRNFDFITIYVHLVFINDFIAKNTCNPSLTILQWKNKKFKRKILTIVDSIMTPKTMLLLERAHI